MIDYIVITASGLHFDCQRWESVITASGLQVPITYERGQVITASGLLCDYSDENDAFNDIDNFFKADPDQNKLNSDTDTDKRYIR